MPGLRARSPKALLGFLEHLGPDEGSELWAQWVVDGPASLMLAFFLLLTPHGGLARYTSDY